MKKLIFTLTSLLMMVFSAAAEVIGGADAATEIVVESINVGDLLGKGLIVTAGGLLGVFLVLILFFFTIKLMQKILK